jgi:hypothetical protein
MAKYIEREAVIEAICQGCKEQFGAEPCEPSECCLLYAVKTVHAADVAPVVRCKDCKHSYEDLCGRVCSYGVSVDCVVPDDFFCADGAKMDGGKE